MIILKETVVIESQIQVVSHDDTVQPYPENDKNRCVIIVNQQQPYCLLMQECPEAVMLPGVFCILFLQMPA